MQRDDAPTATHAPDDALTRTAAPVSHAGLLLTLTRGADRPPPPDAQFRFAIGTVLGNRYRIVAPLGRGGMGEVYRADDLTLGQSVALKFLPEHVSNNPTTLARFRKEVAAARQVAHPHVCRVFDIGEADGQVFLSMEFIPGDDLGGVLRRAGRLSSGLAIDLARQVAAGLQAVHDEGLVHRDLKPANVMIDARGRARIADFGLAATAESVAGLDAYAGTPAYQAPEQLSGGAISERTDVYALGVLAYELLTGQRPFDATDRKELVQSQQTEKPAPPSAFDPTIPPEVDRVVLKCLHPDPLHRPASAHEVWRTLPGDAALNAALAAGQTPSAEVVADAGGEGRLKRRTAVLLAGLILLFTTVTGLCQKRTWELSATVLPPDELKARCRAVLESVGHPADSPYTVSEFDFDTDERDWRDKHDLAPDRFGPDANSRFVTNVYWHRVSRTPLIPPLTLREQWRVRPIEPVFGGAGSAFVRVDTCGRLLSLKLCPAAERLRDRAAEPDWTGLFRAAGFDHTAFRPVDPQRLWTVPHDARLAWLGVYPERPSIPVTVEVATDRGEVVGFAAVAPWTPVEQDDALGDSTSAGWYRLWWMVIPTLALVVGSYLARRNVLAGVADTRGAVRFAVGFACLHSVMHALWLPRIPPTGREFIDVYLLVAQVVFNALRLAVAYLALEPFVRRRWPWRLVGWQRVLAGRWLSPHVGRDLLRGVAAGSFAAAFATGIVHLPDWIGLTPELRPLFALPWSQPIGFLSSLSLRAADSSMMILFLIFVLSRLLRTPWVWIPVMFAILLLGPLGTTGGGPNPLLDRLSALALAGVVLIALLRFGLLVLMVTWFSGFAIGVLPLFHGWGTWFWSASALGWVVLLSLTLYGLVVSVGGWRRLVRADTAG